MASIFQTRTILSLLIFYVTACSCTEEEDRLLEKLLTGHNANVRPVENYNDVITVGIGMSLNQIIKLDERNQVLIIKAWMNYAWTDSHLTWNASDYSGISRTHVLPSQIWKPDITLYTSLRSAEGAAFNYYYATLDNNGSVTWDVPAILETTCSIDVTYFPFDSQTCPLKFGSWSYNGGALDLVNLSSSGSTQVYEVNGEWTLQGFPVAKNLLYYSCCPDPYPDVTYTVKIMRKPLYYLYNLIIPCIFVLACAVLVFYLPPESGEKVSLGVTVLLALTVFLLLVADIMPPQSNSIPLIAQFFGATVIMLAISTILTVININIYNRGTFGNRVPACIRKVVLDWLARLLCLKETVDSNLSQQNGHKQTQVGTEEILEISTDSIGKEQNRTPVEGISMTDNLLMQILEVTTDLRDSQKAKDDGDAIVHDWMLVSMVIDRFLLILFSILTIIVSCSILFNRPDMM